jgi:hypothetical protein
MDQSWAYPCCANAHDYKRECADRGELLQRAQKGVVLDKAGAPEPLSLSKAPIASVKRGLELRGVTEDSTPPGSPKSSWRRSSCRRRSILS